MRLHVISLPHTQTTKAYSTCAYTEKVRKFSSMMTDLGIETYLYAGSKNEARCTEHICCITPFQQRKAGFRGPKDYLKIDFNAPEPWGIFHKSVVKELKKRIQPQDFILVITGIPTASLTEEFPNNPIVEFGVGYAGVQHPYCVFESNAWRNFVYGTKGWNGRFFDETIPNYFEVDDFPFVAAEERQDYYLFIGRLNADKGLGIAQEVCEKIGANLIVAGPGEFSGYGQYVGVVGPEERARLMGHAKAVFVPTLYVAPFEGVHIEANLCGTPVITTDFGVFTETVVDEVNGLRCKMFDEFVSAARYYEKEGIDYDAIRVGAVQKYSTNRIAYQYANYFARLTTLFFDGWYQERPVIEEA